MNITLIVMSGFGMVLLIILFLNYLKDVEIAKRFKRFEKSIEDLHKKVYKIEYQNRNDVSLGKLENLIEQKIGQDIERVALPIADAINNIKDSITLLQKEVTHKIEHIKEQETYHYNETLKPEEDIVELFKQGYSEVEIAKELRVGREQVDLTLKINGLK